MANNKDKNQKICPSCQSAFTCEKENDCWCESAQIHKKDMIILMAKYDDCICPSCLESYAEN